jgi:hypothetical protein
MKASTMAAKAEQVAPALYHDDETAWLELTARLIAERRYDELDHEHLSEYLFDMARRDRREVFSRLVVLMTHLLKWEQQPEKRTSSWRGTVLEQRRELRLLLESEALRNYAIHVLDDAHQEAREQASAETGLPLLTFPQESPWSLDELVAKEADRGEAATSSS